MQKDLTSTLSIASIAFGVILYLTSVLGLFFKAASPPLDVGLLSTTGIFVLFGVLGLMLAKARAESSA